MRLKLLAQLEGVQAEAELRADPWGSELTHDDFFDRVLAATGSKAEATRRTKIRRAAMARESSSPS